MQEKMKNIAISRLLKSLKVTNGYATPFITSFKGDPAMLDTFAANNATLLEMCIRDSSGHLRHRHGESYRL